MCPQSTFRIELLTDIDLLRQCLEIQRRAWGFTDVDILPLRMLVVCTRIGGHVLGARSTDGKVVGFLNAMPGFRDGEVYLHSHMMGVLPEYQNLGVGRSLKWAQREEALSRGIRLIEWTFDPFEFRNARFNIELLGVICRRYLVNSYGITSSPLHGGLPTDRFIAEWHLDSPRVKQRLQGFASESRTSPATCVDLPIIFSEMKMKDLASALSVQLEFREKMVSLFAQNLCVTGFSLDLKCQQARYHLQFQNPEITEL
jgi:predicted GNAT superfamily acetyltransferase